MLAKKFSITKQEFLRIYKKGKKIFSSEFIIKFFPNNKQFSQYAVVVSKKIASKATQRNKIRRTIKQWIKEKIKNLPDGFYIIIIVKNNILGKNNLIIEKKELFEALSKIY